MESAGGRHTTLLRLNVASPSCRYLWDSDALPMLENPGKPVAEVCGAVSIVTQTAASHSRFHPQLLLGMKACTRCRSWKSWQCFMEQTWPDKELVVGGDLPKWAFTICSAVLYLVLEDKRLKYIYIAIKLLVGAVVQVDFLEGHVAVILTGVGSDRLEVLRYWKHKKLTQQWMLAAVYLQS